MAGTQVATPLLQAFARRVQRARRRRGHGLLRRRLRPRRCRAAPAPGGRRLVGKEQVREGIQSRFDGHPRRPLRRRPPLGLRRPRRLRVDADAGPGRTASASRCAGATCSSSAAARSPRRTPTGRSSTERSRRAGRAASGRPRRSAPCVAHRAGRAPRREVTTTQVARRRGGRPRRPRCRRRRRRGRGGWRSGPRRARALGHGRRLGAVEVHEQVLASPSSPICSVRRRAAPARSFHQPSGRLPITLLPSTTSTQIAASRSSTRASAACAAPASWKISSSAIRAAYVECRACGSDVPGEDHRKEHP